MGKINPELAAKHWLRMSEEDMVTAKAMLKAHRYTWCAFVCQQAIEKYLKAGYVRKVKKIPPYIHKLERLCQVLKIEPSGQILNEIIKIDKYYIAARYPSYKKSINISTYRTAASIFKNTAEIVKWLSKELKL